MAVGLALGFADLRGWFRSAVREQVLNWALKSTVGLPLSEPGAVAFMKSFPPPSGEEPSNLTHLTKQVIRSQGGPVMMGSINYMRRDTTRTAYVATIDALRVWANETPYPWVSWVVTLFGFLEVLTSWVVEVRQEPMTG